MSEIEKIYYNFHDEFADSPETKQARDELEVIIKELIPKEDVPRLSDAATLVTAENEKQGFIYGFQYAVALLTSRKAV